MRGVLCLFFAISFFASLLGCGQEGDEQETVPPEVTFVNWGSFLDLREGDIVPGNATFTVGFSKVMEWVEINVSGAEGTTRLTGNQAEWILKPWWPSIGTPTPYDILTRPAEPCFSPIPEGSHTLMVTGRDKSGRNLEGFEPINFTAMGPDCGPPGINGSKCDPRDGATDVDPQQYKEKLVIEFDQQMPEVKVFSTEPEFPYMAELSADNKELIISFADGYTMPGGTTFCIQLVGSDMAGIMFGSWPEPEEYSFTTKAE